MRRHWLACAALAAKAAFAALAALAAIALSVPALAGLSVGAGLAQAAPLSAQRNAIDRPIQRVAQHRLHQEESVDQRVAAYVQRLEGVPYVYGGSSPAGFDCSGLTQYVYAHFGMRIQRTAELQFLQFRRISQARAWPGDLVFFHDTSDPDSYVYHVGVYEGGDDMVAATVPGGQVQWQSFAWAGDTVTFGTITH